MFRVPDMTIICQNDHHPEVEKTEGVRDASKPMNSHSTGDITGTTKTWKRLRGWENDFNLATMRVQ